MNKALVLLGLIVLVLALTMIPGMNGAGPKMPEMPGGGIPGVPKMPEMPGGGIPGAPQMPGK